MEHFVKLLSALFVYCLVFISLDLCSLSLAREENDHESFRALHASSASHTTHSRRYVFRRRRIRVRRALPSYYGFQIHTGGSFNPGSVIPPPTSQPKSIPSLPAPSPKSIPSLPTPPPKSIPTLSTNVCNDLSSMINSINDFRQQNGKAPLSTCAALSDAAAKHSNYMAQLRTMAHDLDGEPCFKDRLQQYGSAFTSHAENVAKGQSSIATVMDDWIKSPGHRANLLGDYNLVGFACTCLGQGEIYWTQEFASAPSGRCPSTK